MKKIGKIFCLFLRTKLETLKNTLFVSMMAGA